MKYRRRIGKDKVTCLFGANVDAIATVEPSELLTIETRDAYNGSFELDMDVERHARISSPATMNPVTGPIAVAGAQPGDSLIIHVDKIRLGSIGYVAATSGLGIMADHKVEPDAAKFVVRDGRVWLDDGIDLPLRPMIGTIGVAPAGEPIISLDLGNHGGNLDLNEITEGSTITLPVNVDGALFAIGDVHATMGSGEGHSGVNIDAEIDLHVGIVKGALAPAPIIRTEKEFITIGVAPKLEAALVKAASVMEMELVRRLDITPTRARMLLGSSVDLRLGQAGGYGVNVSFCAAFPMDSL